MKKILFCIRDFSTGGVQKSLINLLNFLSDAVYKKEISIDVFVLKNYGELKSDIPSYVNIIEANKALWKFGLSSKQAKAHGFGFYLKRCVSAVVAKFFKNKILLKHALNKQSFLGEYDAVISYAISISDKSLYAGWTEVALQKTISKNKIVYIHNDFLKSGLDNDYTMSLIKQFDKIWFVSKSCAKSFCEKYPQYQDKTNWLFNIINENEIKEKALRKCEISAQKGKVNIVSVSRLSPEKAHLRTLHVLKRLKDENINNFYWHVLGDGPMLETIKKTVKELALENYVKLYGNITNPYNIIKNMDLLFLGSMNESFGLVLIDAMILGVPVMTTKTISVDEVVGNNGIICENTEEGIYNNLKNVLTNKNALSNLKNNLKNYKYDNEKIIDKFMEEIE